MENDTNKLVFPSESSKETLLSVIHYKETKIQSHPLYRSSLQISLNQSVLKDETEEQRYFCDFFFMNLLCKTILIKAWFYLM